MSIAAAIIPAAHIGLRHVVGDAETHIKDIVLPVARREEVFAQALWERKDVLSANGMGGVPCESVR